MSELLTNIRTRLLTQEKLIFVLWILLVVHIVFRILKNNLKKKYYTTLGLGLTKENNEEIVYYYKQRYILDSINYLIILCLIVLYLYSINVNFWFFSVAIWAFILIIQPYIQSLIAYPIITTKYKIGDTIKIENRIGDIIFIKPLITWFTGRNLMGEHTGEVHTIPNSKFISTDVTHLSIKGMDIKKNLITFTYDYDTFKVPYPVFLNKIKVFLHDFLPMRSLEECGPYKSYIGHKFKLSSNYEGNDLKITIAYLETFNGTRHSQEQIIWFIENLKIEHWDKKDIIKKEKTQD